jgi:hypothetical protein
MSDPRIMFAQILPNCLSPIIVTGSLMVATAILTESALSFLGLGDPNVMSRGFMIGAGAHTCVRPGGSPPSPASSSSSPCSPSTWWARGRPAPASRPSRRPRRSPRLGPRPRVPGGLDTRTRRMLSRQRCRNRCRTCATVTSASPISPGPWGWGQIVNVSSRIAVDGRPGTGLYAAKVALHGLTHTSRRSWGRPGSS